MYMYVFMCHSVTCCLHTVSERSSHLQLGSQHTGQLYKWGRQYHCFYVTDTRKVILPAFILAYSCWSVVTWKHWDDCLFSFGFVWMLFGFLLTKASLFDWWFSLPSARQHPSYGDCLEVKRKYYQNCSVLDCVTQCSQSAAHLCEQSLQVQQIGFVTLLSHCGKNAGKIIGMCQFVRLTLCVEAVV